MIPETRYFKFNDGQVNYKVKLPSENNAVVTLDKKKYTYLSGTWMVLWLRNSNSKQKSEISLENNWYDNKQPEITPAEGRGLTSNYTENYIFLNNLLFVRKVLKVFNTLIEINTKTERPSKLAFEELIKEEFKNDKSI